MQSPTAVATLKQIAAAHLREEHGQDLLEYGLLAALISIFALAAVTTLGQTIRNVFWQTIAGNF